MDTLLAAVSLRGRLRLWRVAATLGVAPPPWLIPNAFKLHEFYTLLDGAHLEPHHRVLDFGCGYGVQTAALASLAGQVMGIDLSTRKIEMAQRMIRHDRRRKRIRFHADDIHALPLPPMSFDRVLSFSVLEHCHDLSRILLRFRELLRPGGELHASVDALSGIDAAVRAEHQREHHVVRYFAEGEIASLLESCAFEVMSVRPILTSKSAHDLFVERIRQGHRLSLPARLSAARRFAREDGRARSNGLMLIVRARRPLRPEDD